MVAATVIAVGLLAAGGTVALLWGERGAEEASVQDALDAFRDHDQDPPAPAGRFVRPAEGVYEYRGEGTERLSFLDTRQVQGPRMPATVTHEGSACWRFRIDYNSNHWQEWRYCLRDGILVEEGGRTSQRFEFLVASPESVNTFTCEPPAPAADPDAVPGTVLDQRCIGASSLDDSTVVSAGSSVYLGTEELTVGDDSVTAHHYREERVLTGDQSGTSTADTWFAVDDLLPLRNERTIRVESPSPIGTVTYTEEGSFAAGSSAPRT